MTKNTSNHIKPLKIPKILVLSSKVIAFLSDKWVTVYASKLFTTPIKHKVPKREIDMDQKSIQQMIVIPEINRKVNIYQYGKSEKKVLLVHGWSGRGTQLCKIADEMLKLGYATVSFDAPAHGKSPGNSTIMVDFIASILEIDRLFGPFEIAIGHSLGGMSVLNAIKKDFRVDKAIIIGSGDIVQDITDDFISKLGLKPKISKLLCQYFEKKYGERMENFDAYKAAEKTLIPTLVIHDENDPEVPVKAGIHIYDHLKNGELMLTKRLGHRKILADFLVIEKITNFIKK
ncbi:alpha/beta hydrolase family protein [Flavobacterium gilvum]|uniref:Alpha/beta hydrolase n=1 Tax=Flavobacterium gilvum TaxID=1492737 RepID=A0AAC9I6E3_9FLAO|nr:alpha/beta hydrolase [Flavobacterium gilvum]AOW11371.1 alpha/beta hydrolase [Flavobacterium gilvum]KFC58628.1 alpha/beta hydrolase [Flavobacterium gilvum]